VYQFLPAPDVLRKECAWAWWDGAFTNDELNKIIELGDELKKVTATIGDANIKEEDRKTKISWVPYNQDTSFIYDKLSFVATRVNAEYFGLDLFGFVEDFQYTVYDEVGSHYKWHWDKQNFAKSPRKLSSVLILSDESEYEGGELQLLPCGEEVSLEKKKGRIYFFPTYVVHRVTPVTSGVRRSLVSWAAGPAFK
jgi:PKHD-type hydroxylase